MHIFAEKYQGEGEEEFCVTTEKHSSTTCRSNAHWPRILVSDRQALQVTSTALSKCRSVEKKSLVVFKISYHYYSLRDYIKNILQEFLSNTAKWTVQAKNTQRGMHKGNTHMNIYLPRLFWRRLCSCHRSLPRSDIQRPRPHTPSRFWKVLRIQ